MASHTLSFTIPHDLKLKLEAVTKTGHYDSLSEFLRDAIRTHFKTHRDLRIALAFELHKEKKISVSKAAEIINESLQETKKLLKEREI